jgi:hypothetical protein
MRLAILAGLAFVAGCVTQIAGAGDRDPGAALADLQSLKRDYVILPYEETRQYLVRVVGLRRQFLSYGN